MAPRLTVAELVDLGDLDELLRRIDELCDARDWAGLLDLRRRARSAFEFGGRQLWPAASHAEYRLALEAPGEWAAPVVEAGAGRFALGPLSEVAASTHTWAELAPHLGSGPDAALVAQERVLRGEDLRAHAADVPLAELPLALQPWEPAYPVAAYRPYEAEFGSVDPPRLDAVRPGSGSGYGSGDGEPVDDPEAVHALLELVTPWTTQSNGQAEAVAVTGDALAAVARVATSPNVLMAEVDAAHALALLAWTAASGGAHGRRRGMAMGRFSAWWAVAALAGDLDRWPDIDHAAAALRWYWWAPVTPTSGWALRLAAERPGDGRAFAIEATDRRRA